MKIHHLGYAVRTISEGVDAFRALGYELVSAVTEDASRLVSICFLRKGDWLVELVAPNGEDSPVQKKLLGGIGTPYHICYEVESLEQVISDLAQKGFVVFEPPLAAPALEGCRVAFLYNKIIGILELVEKKGVSDDFGK